MNAVSAVTRTRLTNIQKSATARPQKVIGTLSPYPTETVVTPAHQMPEPMPWAGRPANIAFRRRSSSHIETARQKHEDDDAGVEPQRRRRRQRLDDREPAVLRPHPENGDGDSRQRVPVREIDLALALERHGEGSGGRGVAAIADAVEDLVGSGLDEAIGRSMSAAISFQRSTVRPYHSPFGFFIENGGAW